MPFERVAPSYDGIIEEWRCGPIRVVALAFLFGQTRIQVWLDGEPDVLPDILEPQA